MSEDNSGKDGSDKKERIDLLDGVLIILSFFATLIFCFGVIYCIKKYSHHVKINFIISFYKCLNIYIYQNRERKKEKKVIEFFWGNISDKI